MNIFDELDYIYNEIDDTYEKIEIEARLKGYNKKEVSYFRKRQLNDQAYFLFMFTRLEDRVREISNNLIDLIDNKLTASLNLKEKSAWEILHKQKDINFMNRVALLTQKGQNDYNLINQYYVQRNNIAHGKTFTVVINIPIVISNMKRIYHDLSI